MYARAVLLSAENGQRDAGLGAQGASLAWLTHGEELGIKRNRHIIKAQHGARKHDLTPVVLLYSVQTRIEQNKQIRLLIN